MCVCVCLFVCVCLSVCIYVCLSVLTPVHFCRSSRPPVLLVIRSLLPMHALWFRSSQLSSCLHDDSFSILRCSPGGTLYSLWFTMLIVFCILRVSFLSLNCSWFTSPTVFFVVRHLYYILRDTHPPPPPSLVRSFGLTVRPHS